MVGVANGVANLSVVGGLNSNAFPGASSYLSKTLICPSHLRRGRPEKRQMKASERQAWVTADGEETQNSVWQHPKSLKRTYLKHPVTEWNHLQHGR